MDWEYLFLFFFLVGSWMLFKIPDLSRSRPNTINFNLSNVTVIIPVRNEESRIKPLLASLKAQIMQPGEIIVVDDQSEDNTVQVVREAGFRVVTGDPLPPDWQGKSWVCWQGVLLAQGSVIIFLDADTVLEKDGLIRIYHEFSKDCSPLSIQPYHDTKHLYENLSSYFNLIMIMGTCSFTPLGSRVKPRAFFGPCQIMKRSDYLQVGGHSSIKSSVLDDVALGHLLTKAGISIRNRSGKGGICFRMYPLGLMDLVQGWSKNIAFGSQSIGQVPMLLIAGWIYASGSTFIGATRTVLHFSQPEFLIMTSLYVLFSLQLWWMLNRIGRFSPLTAVFYPLPLIFFVLVFIRAIFLSFLIRKVMWKGRTLSIRKEL